MSFPIATRLLRQYKQGVLDQLLVVAKHDTVEARKSAKSREHINRPKPTEYEKVKAILMEVEREIELIEMI